MGKGGRKGSRGRERWRKGEDGWEDEMCQPPNVLASRAANLTDGNLLHSSLYSSVI